jgi:hypothetical protein
MATLPQRQVLSNSLHQTRTPKSPLQRNYHTLPPNRPVAACQVEDPLTGLRPAPLGSLPAYAEPCRPA